MSQDLEAIFRAIWYPKYWAKSCLMENAETKGMKHVRKTWEVQTRSQVKFKFNKTQLHTSSLT